MKWLYKIFRLFKSPTCFHKWEILHDGKTSVYENYTPESIPVSTIYIIKLQCKCCGDVKVKQYKVN